MTGSDHVRIFIAASRSEWLPAKVLEFSIKKATKAATDVRLIYEAALENPLPRDKKNHPRTPFSFQRFLIPQLCHYQGRAIYLDADMLVFRDITELWQYHMGGCDVLIVEQLNGHRREQFSVMLMDCDKLHWDINKIVSALDSGELSYSSLMHQLKIAKQVGRTIPARWNALESFDPNETALLHYTDMNRQPWVTHRNPLGYLWLSFLKEALDDGFISLAEVRREVDHGFVRPSLIKWLDDETSSQDTLRRGDKNFIAPFFRTLSGRSLWLKRLKNFTSQIFTS